MLYLIIRQITRQNREARQRLELERQRLDTALNNMIQGLVVYDASARIVTFNRRYIEMFDLSPDIVKPGCHFPDVIQHRKDRGSFGGDVEGVLFCLPAKHRTRQGRSRHHAVRGRAFDSGRLQALGPRRVGRHAWKTSPNGADLEQERDRNYTFLREIIDHIPSQITVKDAHDRRYLLVNRVAEAQFGISRDDIVGKTAFEIFPESIRRDRHRR